SMLIAPREVISVSVQRITDKHFYVPAHAMIYQVLVEFWNENKPIDFITLTQVLKDRELLDQVGGPFFVTSLFTFVPTAANANYYIDIVREKYILRQIIIDCTECTQRAYDDQDDVETLVNDVEQKIFAITQDRYRAQLPSMKDQ